MSEVPTVRVIRLSDDADCVINSDEFDERLHRPYDPAAEPEPSLKPSVDMTKAELLHLAGELGIDVPSGATKADILDAIAAASDGQDEGGADTLIL